MQQQYNAQNDHLLIWVGNQLYPRAEAKVSVFDSSVQGGDAVWEGLRVYNGRIFALDEHLNRLHESAKAMLFEGVPSLEFIKNAIFETLKANQMRNQAHIRLTLTRGEKITSGMDPRLNQTRVWLGRRAAYYRIGAAQLAYELRLKNTPQQPYQQHFSKNRRQYCQCRRRFDAG